MTPRTPIPADKRLSDDQLEKLRKDSNTDGTDWLRLQLIDEALARGERIRELEAAAQGVLDFQGGKHDGPGSFNRVCGKLRAALDAAKEPR